MRHEFKYTGLNNIDYVVTLFHFYCGLRRDYVLGVANGKVGSNPFPFLLWIATLLVGAAYRYIPCSSNPFPFLLWIATLRAGRDTGFPVVRSNPFQQALQQCCSR